MNKLKQQATELPFMIRNHSQSENEILMASLAEKMDHSLKTDSDVKEHQQLEHMQSEEIRFLPLFLKYNSDNELNKLHDQVMSSMNPD